MEKLNFSKCFTRLLVAGATTVAGYQYLNAESNFYELMNAAHYNKAKLIENESLTMQMELLTNNQRFQELTNSKVNVKCYNLPGKEDINHVEGFTFIGAYRKYIKIGRGTINLNSNTCKILTRPDLTHRKIMGMFLYLHEVDHDRGEINEKRADCDALGALQSAVTYYDIN